MAVGASGGCIGSIFFTGRRSSGCIKVPRNVVISEIPSFTNGD